MRIATLVLLAVLVPGMAGGCATKRVWEPDRPRGGHGTRQEIPDQPVTLSADRGGQLVAVTVAPPVLGAGTYIAVENYSGSGLGLVAPFRAATAVELSVAPERGSRSQLRVTASPRGDLHRFQSLQPGGTVATAAAIATSRAVQRGCLIVTTGITPIAPEGHYGVGSTAMRVVITPLAVAIDVLCIPVFIVGGVLLLAGSSH